MTTVNFAKALQDAKSASLEALPVGPYDVEVKSATPTRSSNDKPMIKVTMQVLDGPYARRPVINNFVMSLENPTALAIFFRHMKCFGLTDEFFTALGAAGSLEPVAQALVGRRVKLNLGHRQWQGETRNEVVGISPYTGAPQLADPTRATGFATFGGPATSGVSTPLAPSTPPPAPATSPVASQPAPPVAPSPAPQPGPIASIPAQVVQQFQPVYDAAVAEQSSAQAPPIAVPTDGVPVTETSPSPSTPATSNPPEQPSYDYQQPGEQTVHVPEQQSQPQPQPPAPPAAPPLPF